MLNKYAKVREFVNRLTDDSTFFTLYLMADTEAEKDVLTQKLWQEIATLSLAEQSLLRAEFTRCFLKLPSLASQLLVKITLAAAA
ncbi:hypothetical protein [Runella aurantiaca]|uniref:Uncharacterized protein n=1 Tax=Runella aurantiaca TaxID=2282308 RepID=A0A369I666_9BACT|nr:hypothetical protein [Runella aurantiaca]RDB02993.1 hypothetical protein DVG78_25590 [Runella aurantiaca]